MTTLDDVPVSRGLLGALRSMGATLNELLHVRAAIFGLELREEAQRGKDQFVLTLVAGAFLHIALTLAALLVVAIFWETHRLAAIGLVALLYGACGGAVLLRLRAAAASAPAPFAATRAELARDLADLRP